VHFIDVARITVASGKGGDGCVAYRREKGVPRGGPNGGNGGAGGSVWLIASSASSTLQDFRYKRRYAAPDGGQGEGWRRTGADGGDCEIMVPCGTLVYDDDEGRVIGDLTVPGQRLQVCKGGRGGRGNYEFRTPQRQTPDVASPGTPGEARNLRMELKLLADIGLIGLPNAGKSTLLSRLTAAKPKIADYPFTTLVPNLGIVDLGDYVSCTLADIPGLIEGASEGKGLGHEFLRHVERTRALIYLVDATDPAPAVTLAVLHQELVSYGKRLVDLPCAVVLNKLDLLADESLDAVRNEVQGWARDHSGREHLCISAVTGVGIDSLRHVLRDLYRTAAGSVY
jgi:GTP-binding protein